LAELTRPAWTATFDRLPFPKERHEALDGLFCQELIVGTQAGLQDAPQCQALQAVRFVVHHRHPFRANKEGGDLFRVVSKNRTGQPRWKD
jgi:hypothetical protein